MFAGECSAATMRRMETHANPRGGIAIRPATPADAELILALVRELAEYERAADQVRATAAQLREHLFPPDGSRPLVEAVIGELARRAEGFALFFMNFSTWLGRPGVYLEDLYVRPAARGHGLGKALFTHVGGIAAQRGCPRFEWACLNWNAPAIEFYRRMGARPQDEWTVWRMRMDQRLADEG